MPSTSTQDLIDYFSRGENIPLLIELATDAGGDPEGYGAEDGSTDTLASTMGSALRTFTTSAVGAGLIEDARAASAARAEDVDWDAVWAAAEGTLTRGLLGP